ncbi:hypothetical protein EV188_107239 [Actinomycetospora succinea]|uniref:Uncharacterized protein n=1 Tax=Actinomycetospora succinea TaxID=663603 RepID=A0A4R6V3V4_9PSEU|nr:hypothetical protein [Actinomycetospora succinea]TDQ52859.1 hypothetical protein EV188_107239 [Actinomycetospora succinea]
MTTTTTREDRLPGGGPAPRWSPRRLGHQRWLWWLGALVLAAVAAAIAVGRDPSPEPGIADDGAVNVLTAVIILAPFLVWGFVHQLVSAVRRRVRDDVREYGVGQPVAVRDPDAPVADTKDRVRYLVEVDHVPGAVTVRDRQERGGPGAFLDDGRRRLRLRARSGQMTASGPDGPVLVARRFGPAGRRRWEIAVEGITLRCEVRGAFPVPRRTLVDDDGTAWLVQVGRARRGRVRPSGRVPERLSPAGAAFVLWFVAELDGKIRAARDAPLTGGGSDGGNDSSWWDTGSSDSSSGGGNDTGSDGGSTSSD